jgi:hypothetical protein
VTKHTSLEEFFGCHFEGPFIYAPSFGLSAKLELSLPIPPCSLVVGGVDARLGHGLYGVMMRLADDSSSYISGRGPFLDVFGNEIFLAEDGGRASSPSQVRTPEWSTRLEEIAEAKLLQFNPRLLTHAVNGHSVDQPAPGGLAEGSLVDVFEAARFRRYGLTPGAKYEPELIIDRLFAKLRGVPFPVFLGTLRPTLYLE